MDLQVRRRFTKGQHNAEIQETTFRESWGLGFCQMSLVVALLHESTFLSLIQRRATYLPTLS